MAKRYSKSIDDYKAQTRKVLTERFNADVESIEMGYARSDGMAWIDFEIGGEEYSLEHTVEASQENAPAEYRVNNGVDCFKQLCEGVIRLSYAVNLGIFSVQRELAGMKKLPPAKEPTEAMKELGFKHWPSSEDEIRERARKVKKLYHPDTYEGDENTANRKFQEAVDNEAQALIDWEEGQNEDRPERRDNG